VSGEGWEEVVGEMGEGYGNGCGHCGGGLRER
jgi:hypothetical protein